MKITQRRLEKFLSDNDLYPYSFDTEFAVHRSGNIDEHRIIIVTMQKGKYGLYAGDTSIQIRDTRDPQYAPNKRLFDGDSYDELLKLDIKKHIDNDS